MTQWLVLFREKRFLTKTKGESLETSLVEETIKTEIDGSFEPTQHGIRLFKLLHESVDGHFSVKVDVLSWSEIEEG